MKSGGPLGSFAFPRDCRRPGRQTVYGDDLFNPVKFPTAVMHVRSIRRLIAALR